MGDIQGIGVLYWALSVVFCLALVFAILFWCRNWRNEERENNLRHLQLLAREVRRLSEAIDRLDETAAALQTADEQFSQQVEHIGNLGRDLKRQLTPLAAPAARSSRAESTKPKLDVTPPEPVVFLEESSEDRYAQARDLLLAGQDETDVARRLDMGTAEVRMIARLLEKTGDAE